MQKKNFYLGLILVVGCFACGSKTVNNANTDNDTTSSANSEQNNNDCIIDENKIFNDTTWFLPYADADTRDSTRAIFEQWKLKLPVDEGFNEGCEITLTLYKDSTYSYNSPCEWDFPFYGVFFYCENILYCVNLDLAHEYAPNPNYNPIVVKYVQQFIKNENNLYPKWSKRLIDKEIYKTDMSDTFVLSK